MSLRSQRLRIEHEPSLNHPPDRLRVADVLQRIVIEQHDVGELADLDRTEVVSGADRLRRRLRGDAQHLERWDTRVDEGA